MFKYLVCLALLAFSLNASCEGLSLDGLVLGRSVNAASLYKRVVAPDDSQPGHKIWTADVPATYLGTRISASVVVNPDGRIHNIELRLPLSKLAEVKRDINGYLGTPKSDTSSPSLKGWTVWERRDKETAAGLLSRPESETLLLVLIWTVPEQDQG